MAMMFGGWAREKEEEESSPYWDGHNIGYTNGKIAGFNDGINVAQKLISQSPLLDATLTEELYQALEKLKCK